MDFQQRLEKAIERGKRESDARRSSAAKQGISEEEAKRVHSGLRLTLSELIEERVGKLPDHFPGFRYESIVGDRGWGAAIYRDDAGPGRADYYSRLEMAIRPFSQARVLELTAKGTIRDKEMFNRSFHQRLDEVQLATFVESIDLWTLEFAELYAAKS